jgi:hypothetical protein
MQIVTLGSDLGENYMHMIGLDSAGRIGPHVPPPLRTEMYLSIEPKTR